MRLTGISSWFLISTLLFLPVVTALSATANVDECNSKTNLLEQVSCYTAVAKANNDLAFCAQASHEGVRYQCYVIFAEHHASPDICLEIPSATEGHSSLIDSCLSDVAMKAHNPDICERIETTGLRDSCYLKLAKKVNQLALCEKILDVGLKSACTGEPVIVK